MQTLSKREEKKAANRRKLIEATIDSIAERGLVDTTVSAVVERAGLSRGMVNLQFESKEALLVETLRYLTEEWQSAWNAALARTSASSAEQLRATLLAVFERPVFSRKRLSVWHAFWADSKHRATYRAVCGQSDRQYRAALVRLCREVIEEIGDPSLDAELVADSLAGLVSGLWLDVLTIPRTITQERARDICLFVLGRTFPDYFASTGKATQPKSVATHAQVGGV